MPVWNPNAPDTYGLEWLVADSGALVVDADSKAAVARLPSTVAETLQAVALYLPSVTRHSRYALEVYTAGAEEPTDLQTSKFLPIVDVVKENVESHTGSTSNLWSLLAKLDLPNDINTLINFVVRRPSPIRQQRYTCRFDTASALTGRRVLDVRVVMSGNSRIGQIAECLFYDGFNFLSLGSGQLRPSSYNRDVSQMVFGTGILNPFNDLPWKVADVRAFATSLSAGLDFHAIHEARVHQLYLEVVHCAENRLAHGVSSVASPGWTRFELERPDGTDAWPKTVGEHSYVMRRLSGRGAATWAYLDSLAPNPFGAAGLFGSNDTYGAVNDLGSERTLVPAISLELASGSSVDSQPYADQSVARVDTGSTVMQTFVANPGGNYGLVTLVVRPASPNMAAGLTVRLNRPSDNVNVGGTATLSPAAFGALPALADGWRLWKVGLSEPAALVAGTTYRFVLSSSASGAAQGGGHDAWEVSYLDTHGQAANRQFTEGQLTVDGVLLPDADLPITVATVPLPPADPAPDPPPGAPGIFVSPRTFEDTIAAVHVGWYVTSLGVRFGRYEVERHDDISGWQRIAHVTDESVDGFDDFEGRRNQVSTYRIRVQRNDGAVSIWTTAAPITPAAIGGRWLFVSNEFPPIAIAYHCQEPRQYGMLDNQKILELYGRDGAVSFRGTEDRLDEFTLEVWVEQRTGEVGRAVFERIREMSRERLSYICILDPHGWRWFAAITLGMGDENWADGLYTIPVTVRELTRESSTPDPIGT